MAFAGKWETETLDGYDEYCQLIGIPDGVIEKGRVYKVLTDITQNGDDFTWTQTYPQNTKITYNFTIGQECSMQIFGGQTVQATVNMEGDKLRVNFANFSQTSEIKGDKLVEICTVGSKVLKKISKRI